MSPFTFLQPLTRNLKHLPLYNLYDTCHYKQRHITYYNVERVYKRRKKKQSVIYYRMRMTGAKGKMKKMNYLILSDLCLPYFYDAKREKEKKTTQIKYLM